MKGPGEAVIEARGLTKRYPVRNETKTAVSDVNFAVPQGRLWTLCGPSGSGKTTLLGMLGGTIAPTSGEALLCGESITHLRDHHRAAFRRERVGLVFQDAALLAGMTLCENVLLPLVPVGGPDPGMKDRARGLLDRFALSPFAHLNVERLSGGERQRAAIVRALVMDPPVLLLDEPTANVDAAAVSRLLALLFELRDEGRTILAATHDPRLAEDARIDQSLELTDGEIRP
jgi:putative ABC transport system ATP-binding protein